MTEPASQDGIDPSTEEDAMAEISWIKDVDSALAQARAAKKPILMDFNAAPQ